MTTDVMKPYRYEPTMAEVIAAEHQARCDLIDALFYADIMAGRWGSGITSGEKAAAGEFAEKMRTRYPMQKGRRFETDAGGVETP